MTSLWLTGSSRGHSDPCKCGAVGGLGDGGELGIQAPSVHDGRRWGARELPLAFIQMGPAHKTLRITARSQNNRRPEKGRTTYQGGYHDTITIRIGACGAAGDVGRGRRG